MSGGIRTRKSPRFSSVPGLWERSLPLQLVQEVVPNVPQVCSL